MPVKDLSGCVSHVNKGFLKITHCNDTIYGGGPWLNGQLHSGKPNM